MGHCRLRARGPSGQEEPSYFTSKCELGGAATDSPAGATRFDGNQRARQELRKKEDSSARNSRGRSDCLKSLESPSAGLDRRRGKRVCLPFLFGCTGLASWSIGGPYPRAGRATCPPNLGGQYTAGKKDVKRKEQRKVQNIVATCRNGLDVVVELQHGTRCRFSSPPCTEFASKLNA